MAADYLIASLPSLALDGPAPISMERFLASCREQIGKKATAGIEAALACAPSSHPVAERWRDLETQLRNAAAAERARNAGQDPAKWRHPAVGCSLYWTNRVATAFQEKDPAKRERLLDQVRWDAAGELTPVTSPLSSAAAFTYAIRLAISIRRSALGTDAGNEVFNRLTAASAPGSVLKE